MHAEFTLVNSLKVEGGGGILRSSCNNFLVNLRKLTLKFVGDIPVTIHFPVIAEVKREAVLVDNKY